MLSLVPGVLLKLLLNMNDADAVKVTGKHRSTSLLQVVSIVPVSVGDELFPDKGFYLKVSDSSHAMYLSLPMEHLDWVLSDRLQVGQYIYVCSFEAASPFPLLLGVHPVPGRHPIVGRPVDIVSSYSPEYIGSEKVKTSGRGVGAHRRSVWNRLSASNKIPAKPSFSVMKARPGRLRVDQDKESSGKSKSIPSSLKQVTTKVLETPSMEKKKQQLIRNFMQRIEYGAQALKKKLNENTKHEGGHKEKTSKLNTDDVNGESLDDANIQWDSLPSSLSKLSINILRNRDAAQVAAIQTLQEAAASESLLQCLSMCHNLISTAKENDPQQVFEKFFTLHSRLKNVQIEHKSEEAMKVAAKRWKLARPWVQVALSPSSKYKPMIVIDVPDKQCSSKSHVEARTILGSKLTHDKTIDLAERLRIYLQHWFLGFVEKVLDVNEQIDGMKNQLERVTSWMDEICEELSKNLEDDRQR